jgi:hypothetical protein
MNYVKIGGDMIRINVNNESIRNIIVSTIPPVIIDGNRVIFKREFKNQVSGILWEISKRIKCED